MDPFPDVIADIFCDVPPPEEVDFLHDPADFNLAPAIVLDSDSDDGAEAMLDEPSLLNVTLRKIDFNPDSK